MFKLKKKKDQVTFPGLGSVCPVFIVRFHLLPTNRELPVTAKQPLCLPGQGGEIYPTRSTWERTWIWLESEGTWRAFLFHLLSHQNPLQTKDSPANETIVFCFCFFLTWSRSFKRACSFPLTQTMLRVGHSFMQKDCIYVTQLRRKGKWGVNKPKKKNFFFFFILTTSWYLVSRTGITTAPHTK